MAWSGRKPESRSEGKRGREVAGPSCIIVLYSIIKSSPPLFLPDQRLTVSLKEKVTVLSYRFYPETKADRTDIANIEELARTSTPIDQLEQATKQEIASALISLKL